MNHLMDDSFFDDCDSREGFLQILATLYATTAQIFKFMQWFCVKSLKLKKKQLACIKQAHDSLSLGIVRLFTFYFWFIFLILIKRVISARSFSSSFMRIR